MNAPGNSARSRDIAHYLHPYTNLKRHEEAGPHIITGGEGIYVTDEDGKQYIEGLAGLWCTSLGFGEPRLVEAGRRQLEQLPYYHSFAHKNHDVGIEVADRLIALAPVPMSKVFFACSGSEANDTVVKLVWYYNNARGLHAKKKILARRKGYHGVTVASASMTGLPHNHRAFDLPIHNIMHVDTPHHYHEALEGESEEDFATRLAEALDQRILDEGPDTVAAFIAEPVMGAGGVVPPPATYFEKVQAVLKKHDVLMIADEVICGFARTGSFWGSQTYGIRPDIMSMAKALTSAYAPLSAVMISDEVFQAIARQSDEIGMFGHGFTYSGHPLCTAIALETLKIYEERDIVSQVRAVMPRFGERFRALASHPLVGEVRVAGLMGAAELVADKDAKENFDPSKKVGQFMADAARDEGLMCRGLPGDSVALCPPLIITDAQIDEMFDRYERALARTWEMVSTAGLAKVA